MNAFASNRGLFLHLAGVRGMSAFSTQSHSTIDTKGRRKTVRITLPPSPPAESEMDFSSQENQTNEPRRSQRINVSSSQDVSRIVLPTDTVEKADRLRSGSKWRQRDLALLKVKFDPEEDSELAMLDVDHEWSPSQRQSISFLIIKWYALITCDRSRLFSQGTRGSHPRGFRAC